MLPAQPGGSCLCLLRGRASSAVSLTSLLWLLFSVVTSLERGMPSFPLSSCPGLTPASSQAPRSSSLTPSPAALRREFRVKIGKLMGWNKDSLIGRAKALHTRKTKQGIDSLLPMGRQVFCHPWGAQPHHMEQVGNTNTITPNVLSFLPPLYLLTMLSCGLEYPSGLLGSPVLAGFPPKHPYIPWKCGSMKAEKALALCKPCSAITKTSLYFQPCVQHK